MTDTPSYDATVSHSIYVERYKSRISNEIVAMINGVSNGLYRDISSSDLDGLTRRQLNRLLNDVKASIRTGYVPITEAIEEHLKDFSVYEAGWQSEMLSRVGIIADLAVPSDADLWAAVAARPFEGRLLAGWLAGLSVNTASRVEETIRQGYVDGLGPLEVARLIRGTKTQSGVMDISKRGAQAMVRTAMASVSSVSKERSYQSRRGIQKVQWVSVLDGRTSAICRSRDGNIYPKNEGPRPPAHVSCRSTIIPVTKGNEKRLEDRETYQQWLKRQSAAKQDDILGPSRGKLFRDGGYKVDRFVDESGQTYTLDQLKQKDNQTFKEVFAE